jgi:hypothetical protein
MGTGSESVFVQAYCIGRRKYGSDKLGFYIEFYLLDLLPRF